MKKEDKYTMQITTVHKFQKVLDGILKVIKFIRRHAFVLIVLGMMLSTVSIETANWKNIFLTISVAVLVDFFKLKIKISRSQSGFNNAHKQIFEYARRNRDSSADQMRTGLTSWSTDAYSYGSSAYNIRQDRMNSY